MKRILWKIGGEAGYGIMTTGIVLSKIASRLGYHVFDSVEYPSLIRGGHNTYDVFISDEEVHSLKYKIDYLICLNKDTFELHKDRLTSSTLVVYDPNGFDPGEGFQKVPIPFSEILKNHEGKIVMENMIALGASLALMGGDLTILNEIITEQFSKKGEAVVEINHKFAAEGFKYIKDNHQKMIKPILESQEADKKLVLTGNEAFALGSVIADCRLYAAYPMTPATGVMTTLALWQNKTGMVVRHSEDEIAAVLSAIGGSFAGVRSATGSSGGGFALMVEAISLAGITETPLVIFLSQRPGPATGMPTWTEQADLLFAINAGHGEFPKIVLAPGDVDEMIELSTKAYNLADVYQTPVIVMSDMFLSESHQTITQIFLDNLIGQYEINRGKLVVKPSDQNYLRYKETKDGISERLIPGAKGYFYQANSYEHFEDGHTTEDSWVRINQVNKRKNKIINYLATDFVLPKIYGDFNKAETVFVAWGSIKGPILEAMRLLKEEKKQTALIHFNHVYPLDEKKIKNLFKVKKNYLLVENNSEGQFGKLLKQETGINIEHKLLKYDGRTFWPEEIQRYVNNK